MGARLYGAQSFVLCLLVGQLCVEGINLTLVENVEGVYVRELLEARSAKMVGNAKLKREHLVLCRQAAALKVASGPVEVRLVGLPTKVKGQTELVAELPLAYYAGAKAEGVCVVRHVSPQSGTEVGYQVPAARVAIAREEVAEVQ